jgi:two-component sensor histidine kinase
MAPRGFVTIRRLRPPADAPRNNVRLGSSRLAWAARLSAITRRRQGVKVWLLAALFVALALGLRLAMGRWLSMVPFAPFFIAIMAAALVCGARPAAAALCLSAIAGWYFCLPPLWSFALAGPQAVTALIAFLVVGAAQIALVAALAELVSRLDRSNEVRDNLYQELQHRVANNMQIVAGMLHTARRRIDNETASQVIAGAEARIHAMGQLHRRLFASTAFNDGLAPVIADVRAESFSGLDVGAHIDIAPARLTVSQMSAIVLLVNEAATNAAKHVFRPALGRNFTVKLQNSAAAQLRLVMSDDGPGTPHAAQPGPQPPGLGMDIMRGFARQLGGSLQRADGPGTAFSVEFTLRP